MACVTLKRCHFDLSTSPVQEPRSEPSAKRRCSIAAMASYTTTPTRSYAAATCSTIFNHSPVSKERMLADVNGELKMIRRKRRYLESQKQESPIHRKERPVLTPSKMTLDCENLPTGTSPAAKSPCEASSKKEKPVFTAKQVADFCQMKLKEREEELKVLFDQILNERLTEQYDSFVRFTEENLRRHFADRECSYVS